MKRSESLALLHAWAEAARIGWHPNDAFLDPFAIAADTHGIAAVSAINNEAAICHGLYPDICILQTGAIIRESRLAVRAALRAVGLKGAL